MDGYAVRTLHLERTRMDISSSCTYNHNTLHAFNYCSELKFFQLEPADGN